MALEVVQPGLCTTIQDNGRVGFQDQGIPVSGFMDVSAAHLANALVNNSPNTPAIEMMLVGATFKIKTTTSIAITGADMEARVDGCLVPLHKMIVIPKNSILSFSGAINGVYTYISFAGGGIKATTDFNSKSTYLPAKIGGHKGRALQKKDVLNIHTQKLTTTHSKVKRSPYANTIILSAFKGPEWDCFSKASQKAFLNTPFRVSKNSNRIGIRLEGSKVELPKIDEIISSGIVKGTVQITKAGHPIIMMADAPTTGGYLRIVNLSLFACNHLAQIPVGGIVFFALDEKVKL